MKSTSPRSLALAALSLSATSLAAVSKRGLLLQRDRTQADLDKFIPSASWYANWEANPVTQMSSSGLEFVPTIPNVASIEASIAAINSQKPGHLLTFNEPDQSEAGSSQYIDPAQAAQLYISKIVPLRKAGWKISHPTVTSSPQGMAWLKQFVTACAAGGGCPADFIAAHYYGPYDYLANTYWPQLSAFYNNSANTFLDATGQANLKYWFSELGISGANIADTKTMITTTLPFLDSNAAIERYAWFGLFRVGSADAGLWPGPSVSMLDSSGALSVIGDFYVSVQH